MKNKTAVRILEQELELNSGTSIGISSTDTNIVKDILFQLSTQPLNSILYIDHHDMLYQNMNVLEYLMFATRHIRKMDTLSLQQELFELLVSVGLGYISLTPITALTPEEQMVILLCIALYSNESILVFDASEYEFSMSLIQCINALIQHLKKAETTLIFGTMQPKLIGICLKETLFVHEQQIRYYGSVDALYHSMDRVLYVLNHSTSDALVPRLELAFPMYEIRTGNGLIFVMRKDSMNRDDTHFFATLAQERIIPDFIKINHGRVENSFQELIEFNAILK